MVWHVNELRREQIVGRKNDYSNVQERPVTFSELRKIVEELPDGIMLQIEFIDSEDGENESKSQ